MNSVKSCDLSGYVAAQLLVALNPGRVSLRDYDRDFVLVTDINPSQLDYPEGWYFAKGNFRNKHNSTTGFYSEVAMVRSDGQYWG